MTTKQETVMRRDRDVAHALMRAVSTLVSTSLEALPADRSRPRALLLLVPLFLLTTTASAQLALYSFDGTTEAAVGATYNFASAATGSTASVRFRVFNNGTSPVTISAVTISGFGFSISAVNGTLPYPLAPANFLESTVEFAPTIVANYSASLQIGSINVLLTAAGVASTPAQGTVAPTLTAGPGCTISNNAIALGNINIGSSYQCAFSLLNPNAQAITVSKITVASQAPFQLQQLAATPLTLPAGQTVPAFVIEITPPCGNPFLSGTLSIDSQTFSLTGSAITPALAKPAITFDAVSFASAQQHTLMLSLPSAPPCAVTGNLNLVFTSTIAGVADDASIVFVQGSRRSLQFTVAANSTQVSIAGQQSVVFQTGTTAGTITFTVTGTPLAADATTTITIPPAPISIDLATASNQVLGQLNVEVSGFDNTYSAGAMSFTFFDTAGKQMGSVIDANFTSCFAGYFGIGAATTGCSPSGQNSGSTFLMQVSFPIQGNQTLVGTVQATLTNSAGPAQTGSLTFQ
jgi:hypothetical protein